MRIRLTTLAGRLLLAACLFLTAALIAAGIVLAVILQHVVAGQVEERLQGQAGALLSAVDFDDRGTLRLAANLDGPPFDRIGSGWYWQIEAEEGVMRSRSLAAARLEAPPPMSDMLDWKRLFSARNPMVPGEDARGRPLMVLTQAAIVEGRTVTVRVSAPRGAVTGPLRQVLFWLVPSVGLLGLLLLAAILLQIRLGLRPLKALGDSLKAVRAGTESRVPSEQPAELAPVVDELNALIEESEERLATARLNLANLAHSLKTPLASLSLAVRDQGRDGGRDPDGTLAALTDQIEMRIRHHLGRARATAAGARQHRLIAIAPRLADLTGVMQKIYAHRGIALVLSLDQNAKAACEAQDFDEIAGNILDNAFKWATSRVSVSATTEAGRVRIVIEDDGPGIPADFIGNAFLPGQRLDETVPGHGFGLSISRELIQLHGGRLSLGPAEDTESGLRAEIDLPIWS